MMRFTVAICTYNRADLLAGALESVLYQEGDSGLYEILVVDNRSTDHTRAVVEAAMQRDARVRYVHEETQGIAAARNRAWQEGRGQYIAYLDDDGKASTNWLAVAARVIQQHAPDVFGGPFYAFFNTAPPAWFREAYGSWEMGGLACELRDEQYLCAGNLVVRRAVFEALGGFDPCFGHAGAKLAYGEEVDFVRQVRMRLPGARIRYEPELRVSHLVRPEKYSLAWQMRNHFIEGGYRYRAFTGGQGRVGLRHALGFVGLPILVLLEAGPGVALRSRRRYPYWQNYYVEKVFYHLGLWGKLYERVRQALPG